MLNLDTERTLYGGVATLQRCTQKQGECVLKLLESVPMPDAVRDEIEDLIQEMSEGALITMGYLQQEVCVHVGAEEFKQMQQQARETALEWSREWDAAVEGDESDDNADDSDSEPQAAAAAEVAAGAGGGGGHSRKRRSSSREGHAGDEEVLDSGRPRRKKPRKASGEGGDGALTEPPSNGGGGRPTNAFAESTLANHRAFFEEQRRRVNELRQEFVRNGKRVMLWKIDLIGIAVRRVEAAFNAEKPNLSLIPDTMIGLARFTQNLSQYERKLAAGMKKDAKEREESIVSYRRDTTIGAIACQQEKKRPKRSRDRFDIPKGLQSLEAAIKRYDGCEKVDIYRIGKALDLGEPFEFLLRNLNNAGMLVKCGSRGSMSMFELYFGHPDCEERAQRLWAAIHSGGNYVPKRTCAVEYVEETLIPALEREELESEAREVAQDMKFDWTDTKDEGRKENLQHFTTGSSYTLSGETDLSQEDHFGKQGKNHKAHAERRRRMTPPIFNVLLRKLIQRRLPPGTFPDDFVRALLLLSPSAIKRQCDFVTRDPQAASRFRTFFDGASHGPDSDIVKSIKSRVKHAANVGEGVYVVDSLAQIEDLLRLLEL